MSKPNVISLELNEVNFHFIQKYNKKGKLKKFARILEKYALQKTNVNVKYSDNEPWIQWPTFYTGKEYEEHNIFRLGDSVHTKHTQIWEKLEEMGVSVGALSPINGANKCNNPSFFIPDPWTETEVHGDKTAHNVHALLKKAVNQNADKSGLTLSENISLLTYILKFAKLKNYPKYVKYFLLSRKYKWAKAIFLDVFLVDLFITYKDKLNPEFSSLFLNSAAHIQHHHLYESEVYNGRNKNPGWYSRSAEDNVDPLFYVYEAYENIVNDLFKLKGHRILVSTGLSQIPNPKMKYQYRFKSHGEALNDLGLGGFEAVPRMSRDFLLKFKDVDAAKDAETLMRKVKCNDADFFMVDNRGADLFCQICYYDHPDGLKNIEYNGKSFNLSEHINLVSIENGIHQPIGYHLDSELLNSATVEETIKLSSIFYKVTRMFGAEDPKPS